MSVYSPPSIRLGTVYPPDLEPVSEGIEITLEPIEINLKISKAQRSTIREPIRDPDEPAEDPFEAEPPPD